VKFAALAILLVFPLAAQTDHNANAWFMYFGDHPISKTSRWGIHLEGQWRRAELGATWQQMLVRPGVNFQLSKHVSLTGGYGYIDTFRYGDFPAVGKFPEHRFFEQVAINRRIGKFDFANRFRLEQRNIGVLAAQRTSYRYENRIRYQLRTSIPLPFGDKKNYIGLYNEILFNWGKNVDRNVFDQNRAYIALGRDLGHATRGEIGFVEQTLQRRGGLIFEHNHTLQISLTSRLPFGD
jgi:hypothetical protein